MFTNLQRQNLFSGPLNSLARLSLAAALLLALIFSGANAQPVRAADGPLCYVNAGASGEDDGNSWTDAYTDLQFALADANCTEIWVAAGVYKPTPTTTRAVSFVLKNGVEIYGGFAGTETARDQRDWQTNPTILSGDIDDNDVNDDGNFIAETWQDIVGANSHHVVLASNTNSSAVLDGFIITAGQANGGETAPNRGGGLHSGANGSPTVRNVIFSGNFATNHGGGMYNLDGSNPTVTNVTFTGNRANQWGGGMYNTRNSAPTVTNVLFQNNSAEERGGGMANYNNSSPILVNVAFLNNEVAHAGTNDTFGGGGMYNGGSSIDASSPTLINVTFYGNSSTRYGGGIFNRSAAKPALTNVILWGNTAALGALDQRQIYNTASPDNVHNIAYSIVQDGCPAISVCGDGMLYTDPLFIDAASGNLRLGLDSPAIDAGDPNTNLSLFPGGPNNPVDLDGNPRIFNGAIDLGPYEKQPVGEEGYKLYLPLIIRP